MTTDGPLPGVSAQDGTRVSAQDGPDAPVPGRPNAVAQREQRATRARRSHGHPLLRAFPLAVMTLATFLVVFTILMARLQSGVDPALGPAATGSLVVPGSSRGAILTRASGGAAPAVLKSGSPSSSTGPVLTRTSGSRAGGESDDA